MKHASITEPGSAGHGQRRSGKPGYAATTLGIDLRSLAAFRIAAGVLVLIDLALRARFLTAFYTDLGILPRIARIELLERLDTSGMKHTWSLHLANGEMWGQALMFAGAALAAVALVAGYRTRLATVVTWLLLASLDARNPMVLDSGDTLLRCMLFWMMFAPSGAVASLDARRRPPALPSDQILFTAASAALLLQLFMMYWFSVIHKTHPYWLKEHSAVYYALNNDIFVTRLGRSLLAYPALLRCLTALTYWLELVGPLLLFLPIHTARLRTIVVVAFGLLHLGFGLSLNIGLFVVICVACWLLVLPGEFWDALDRWTRDWGIRMRVENWGCRAVDRIESWAGRPEPPRSSLSTLSTCVVVALLSYTVIWNLRELNVDRIGPWLLPREMNIIGRATALEQRWSMFAPVPSTDDGWYVMKGLLRDGSEVNLWQPDRELPWKKPDYVAATFRSQRWRKYLDNLKHDGNALHRQYFSDWLQRRWNRQYARGNRDREVVEVELIFQFEETARPGGDPGEPLTTRLWSWQYE